MGSRTQGVQEIFEKIYIEDVLTPTSLSWGCMGHMEQSH